MIFEIFYIARVRLNDSEKSRNGEGSLVKCTLRGSLYEHKLVDWCCLDIIDGFSLVSIDKIYVYKHRF